MATTDMRLPIQLALGWPERLPTGIRPLRLGDPEGVTSLNFEPVDREAFPALDLAYRVGRLGSTFPAVMNAANEVAVMAFLDGRVPLTRIGEVVAACVDEHEAAPVVSLVSLERADAWARRRAAELLSESPV
jgi:1-deoxy-D-xylulose-5-phosphate reductoisomerase